MAQSRSLVDKPLPKGRDEVSTSAFAFLFSEIVQYSQDRVQRISDLELKLDALGQEVGTRAVEMVSFRERGAKREIRLVAMLQLVTNHLWRMLFGKPADSLQKSTEKDDEYMILESDPITTRYISVPRDLGHLNCAAFGAGVVRGAMTASGFACDVTAHFQQEGAKDKVVYLIKLHADVMARERRLG